MARKDISMSNDEAAAFIERGHTLIVASVGRHGMPHVAPMWYVVDDGRVVFRSFTKSQKITNLRRDPRITALIETGEKYAELQGLMIEGQATLIDDPGYTLGIYGRLAAKYPMVGSEPVILEGEALEAAFGRHATKNTSVIVEPDRIVTWDHMKLAGEY
jgi:PPOX class probable F420-dependent enzyme